MTHSTQHQALAFVGAAFGIGGADPLSAEAPEAFRHSIQLQKLSQQGLNYQWITTIDEATHWPEIQRDCLHHNQSYHHLADSVHKLVRQQRKFCVLGGDHSCAIGTWSGAATALPKDEAIGLIWIDAHMDAHTHETTPSGNVHGMPVAALLGHGDQHLTEVLQASQKIKPENICLIGIRSYEPGEEALLKSLNVKVFTNHDVHRLGISKVIQQAYQHVMQSAQHLGISIDLDGLDPQDAPATGTPVEHGIDAQQFIATLSDLGKDPKLIGYEIVEYSPHLDTNKQTIQVVSDIIANLEQINSEQHNDTEQNTTINQHHHGVTV